MATIALIQGSAAQPQGKGPKIIAYVCNNAGTWEKTGFARTLNRHWPQARVAYKAWYKELGYRLALGTTQLIEIDPQDVMLATMIARPGVKFLPIQPAGIHYDALDKCLHTVANRARYFGASVHMPQLSSWERVEPLVEQALIASGIDVFVYT